MSWTWSLWYRGPDPQNKRLSFVFHCLLLLCLSGGQHLMPLNTNGAKKADKPTSGQKCSGGRERPIGYLRCSSRADLTNNSHALRTEPDLDETLCNCETRNMPRRCVRRRRCSPSSARTGEDQLLLRGGVNRVSAVTRCEVALAKPKSMIRGTGLPSTSPTRMFVGFRSRWMMAFWCACCTPSQT